MKEYYKWISFVLISICIVFSGVAIFNYFIDSFNLFKKSNVNIEQDLLNGYFITGDNVTSNRVDNLYEPLIISNKNNIDVLTIGSSRSMLLHKNILFGEAKLNYYNFTDGTAQLRHYAKILGLLNKNNVALPHTVILGFDPWVFDEKASLAQIKNLLNNHSTRGSNYSQLFNFEYTKINILSLIYKKKYSKSKNFEDLKNSKNIIISPDGSMHYPAQNNSISLDNFLQNVKEQLKVCDENNSSTKCVKYNKLNNFVEVQYLINYLQERDVNVIVFLAPFEPIFYNHIVKYNSFEKHNNDILEFFKENDLKIIGSYDPNVLKLSSNYFIDSIHPNKDAIRLMFKNIKLNRIYQK
jgi:hypothetical protein